MTASIEDGYYAPWWPGDLSGEPELVLTIHLADGTVIDDVPAFADAP